ncbi:hypothetical protein ACWCQ1_50375 [Streptomyces sp. NPDC002144]|uniref:hypothetical protein n=1 Tax=Streptomyces sp. NPDC006668 TaxID=3156903 RepID=UPI001A9D0390
MNDVHITRRMDSEAGSGYQCNANANCPGVFSLSTGDVAFIGQDVTDDLRQELPAGAGVGPGERLVIVPRAVLNSAGWQV